MRYCFPFFFFSQADDNASGIHFTAGRRLSRNRLGSLNSIQSTAGSSVPRVNTVTNVFKRFFSREDSRSPQTLEGRHEYKSTRTNPKSL